MPRFCLFLFVFTLPALAQDRAAINGTVTDPSGAFVAGASVELKSMSTGLHRAAVTDERGLYEITTLPVGSYAITIAKPGFKPVTVNEVDLRYAETRTLDEQLEVGGTADRIEGTEKSLSSATAEKWRGR